MKLAYAIGSVPSLSGHAIAYRWRSLPRVRRHRVSKPQGSSERVLLWQVTMGQLILASLSHTQYWYEVGMLKVPAVQCRYKSNLANVFISDTYEYDRIESLRSSIFGNISIFDISLIFPNRKYFSSVFTLFFSSTTDPVHPTHLHPRESGVLNLCCCSILYRRVVSKQLHSTSSTPTQLRVHIKHHRSTGIE